VHTAMTPALAEGAVLLNQPNSGLSLADEAALLDAGLPPINGDFTGKDLLVAGQLSAADLEIFFGETDLMDHVESDQGKVRLLGNRVVLNEFFEPSTRTDYSSRFAAIALGADVVVFNADGSTSLKKGETDLDTVVTMDQYIGGELGGLHVIRHPDRRFVYEAADAVEHPVINAGNGAGEHVTQGMLDVVTIRRRLGEFAGKTVVFYGDMLKGRTSHSTAELLAKLGVDKMFFVAPNAFQMPEEVLAKLDRLGAAYEMTDDIEGVIADADVLYRMRLQLERFSEEERRAMPRMGMVSPELLEHAKETLVMLHPFPEDSRIPDFHPAVRKDPRFAVWEQTRQGKIARMALFALTLGRPLSGLSDLQRERILSA